MSTQFIDLTGKRAGRLVIVSRAENGKGGQPRWNCVCDCGGKAVSYGPTLRKAINPDKYSATTHATNSCGCLQREVAKARIVAASTTHGQSKTLRYRMWSSAKKRARQAGVPFTLRFVDFPAMPTVCPVLGISINMNARRGPCSNSPTLDRIVPSLGYVKGNVAIISHRANTIKSDGTLDEILAVAEYVRRGTTDLIAVVH